MRLPPRFNFTTNFVFFIVCYYFYSTLRTGYRAVWDVGQSFEPPLQCTLVWFSPVAKDTAYHLRMSRPHPECPDSDARDHLVVADVLLRQEPDEEEDEEEDEGNRKEEDADDDDTDDEGYSE
jgi:hypothetical protein